MPRFSRDEAEALLPRVRPLVEDLQRRKQAYDRRRTEPVLREMEALLREVQELGVEVKDLDLGLIDFRTVRNGREVYLCWRLGEGDRILYWHDLDSGYRGRKLLDNN